MELEERIIKSELDKRDTSEALKDHTEFHRHRQNQMDFPSYHTMNDQALMMENMKEEELNHESKRDYK